jgi:tight adherence protein C
MLATIDHFGDALGIDPRLLVVLGLLLGAFLFVLSIVVTMREGPRHLAGAGSAEAPPESLFVVPERMPTGFAKAFLPNENRERSQIRRELSNAGFDGPNAVVVYYALRSVVGLLVPGAIAAAFFLKDRLPLSDEIKWQLGQIGMGYLLVLLSLIIVVGFYGPAIWLSTRTKRRRERIELGFPNALDLLQVSIEAGLGFDAALARVAEEIAPSSPEISSEFRHAQQEILAGRDREPSYRAMADRLGIDEATAFINVVLQSLRFGTSMSQALLAYSGDMRQRREIRAQEKANKLPVYMSAIMAGLMMPALLIVTIGPVAIRYIRGF